jgi:hypothetical protein
MIAPQSSNAKGVSMFAGNRTKCRNYLRHVYYAQLLKAGVAILKDGKD